MWIPGWNIENVRVAVAGMTPSLITGAKGAVTKAAVAGATTSLMTGANGVITSARVPGVTVWLFTPVTDSARRLSISDAVPGVTTTGAKRGLIAMVFRTARET